MSDHHMPHKFLIGSARIALTITAFSILAACSTGPTPQQLAQANYGPPLSEGYQQKIKDWFELRLIDPTSPLYSFRKPVKGYTKDSPLYGTQLQFGWIVCGTVNGKNRMGAYVGREPFFTLFKEDRLEFVHDGAPAAEVCQKSGAM